MIYGFQSSLNDKTKQDVLNQSLSRINKLLGRDYTLDYKYVLDNLKERVLIHQNRKPEKNARGYFTPSDPHRINIFTDDKNPNTRHHETMHAVFNNLSENDRERLYRYADELFNDNNFVTFNSDTHEGSLYKRQDKLSAIILDNSKSAQEKALAINEFKKLEEIKQERLEELLATVSESRATVLKSKVNPNASIAEQNKAIDLMSDEEIVEVFKNANGYSYNYVQQILKNNDGKIPQSIINNLRTAYKILPMGIPTVVNNNKE